MEEENQPGQPSISSCGEFRGDSVKQISFKEFNAEYDLQGILARGTFSVVRKALARTTQEMVAIKIVDTTKFPASTKSVQREIEALTKIKHDNCTELHAYCSDKNTVYIVMSLVKGMVLVDFLQEKQKCTELETAIISHAILQGVSHLHSKNIVHRDLKLENIMFDGDTLQSVKILDYGFSKILQRDSDVLSTICGSPQYVAPEILYLSLAINEGCYTNAVDAWSIGVIIYMLLAGYAPFDDDSENILFEKIMRGKPDFEEEPWDTVSSEAKDLVAGLLVVDPQLRLTVDEALESTFITQAQEYIERRKSGERLGRRSSTKSL